MINWEVHTLLCPSQFAASPFVTILGCFVSFPLSYFVSAYLSSDSYMDDCIYDYVDCLCKY